MADGGSMDLGRILGGVIEDVAKQLEIGGQNASGLATGLDSAAKSAKGLNRELKETASNIHDIDNTLNDFGGDVFDDEIKSAKQLRKEYRETANQFLDMQKKAGNFKGFSSDDKLSREVTKQFNLIKKGETELWQAQARVRRAAKEIEQAQLPTAQFEKIGAAIDQATQKLGAFLQEIRDVAKEINSKNFGFNFNLADTQGESERLEQYKNMWRSYGQAVGEALNEVARLSNNREFKAAAGPDFQKQIAQVGMLAYEYSAMEKSFKKSMQSVKTFVGADTAGKQLQEYAARIQPIIEKAKELGRSDFDINRFLKPEIPAGALNQAEKLQNILSGVTIQGLKVGEIAAGANGGATAQALNNESSAVQKLNEMYELHRTAVEAATTAESEKTNVSKQLLEALTKEGEALHLNEESNWFANIEKTVSSIDVAVRSINEFQQSFQQLNSAGDSINQNINEPLKQAGEKLREVDVTFLESQLRMVGARMEALRVPSDQMTSSLTAMEDALRDYKDDTLPIKDRNAALAVFNDTNKTANQLIKEQNYLNQQAAKELDGITRAQDALDKSSAKRLTAEQKAAFDDAKRAIEEYYKAQQMLLKDQKAYSDIKLTNNGYQSQSGNYSALAAELNRTKIAYDLVTDAQNKNQLSADGVLKLNQQLAEKQRQYELQLEQANNKEREAAEKAAESARKKQEQAEATERAAKAKRVEAMATQQLKDTERQNSANSKEVANDYSRMLDLLKKIGKESANKQNFLASGELIRAADADKWLKAYIADYRTLRREIGSKLNTKQIEEITHELQNQKRAIDARNAAAQQGAQGDAVKADQALLKNATTSYNEIIKSFDLLKGKSVEAQAAIDNLKTAMDVVKATNPGTEERTRAMEALAQASTTATSAIDAAAEADRRKAEADKLAAKAENERAEAERKSTKDAQEKVRTESKRMNMLVQVQKELVRAEAAEKKFAAAQHTTGLKETYNNLRNTTNGLRDLEHQLRSGVHPTMEMRNQFAQFRSELTRTTADLQLNGNALGRWFTSGVSQLNSRLAYTFGLAAMVHKSVAEIKKMVTTAVELDSAMNTLQIVTRASSSEMTEYGNRVSYMAKETAQATKDLIDATTVYARLGYSMDESSVLSKYTAMLQGVGGIEASTAQDAITAIVKAFHIGVEDIESAMDKMVIVGNNFPISVSQIAEGMNNAGSMLAVANNSFEESIALLTAANTTIQNISKSSTGLRTIAARIRKTSTGEGDDGEVVEESKYNEMISALTKHNVSLVDANNEYRSTYAIIKDIAAVWEEMTSMEQAAVVEALAGTRQQNVFASLMTQFGEAERAINQMSDSAGELQESYDIYLSSIRAHIQTLKAAYAELAMKVVDSNFAKRIIDFGTTIIELITKIVDNIGVLGTALAALSTVAIIKFITGGGIVGAVLSISKLLIGLASIGPYIAGIATIFAAAAAFIKIYKAANPSFEDLKNDADSARKQAEEIAHTIENNAERLKELYEARNAGDITSKQQEEIDQLEKENELLSAQLTIRENIAREKEGKVARKVNDDVNKFFDRKTRNETYGAGPAGGIITEAAESESNKLNKLLDEYTSLTGKIESAQEELLSLNQGQGSLVSMIDRTGAALIDRGFKPGREAYGNVDISSVHALKLSSENAEKYQKAIESWRKDLDGISDTYSELYGSWDTFEIDGQKIDVAFTPVMETPTGPILLDSDTVHDYIKTVLTEASRRGDLSTDTVLSIDNLPTARGIIAGMGEEAQNVAEILNYSGMWESYDKALEQMKDLDEQATAYGEERLEKEQEIAEIESWLRSQREELVGLEDEESIKNLDRIDEALNSIGKVTKKSDAEIDKFKRNLDKLDKTVRDNLSKGIDHLTDSDMKKLDEWLKRCGYDMQQFTDMLSDMNTATSDIEVDESAKDVVDIQIARWALLTDEIEKATLAKQKYDEAMKGGNNDALVKSYAEAWKLAYDDVMAGKYGSEAVKAFVDLALPKDVIAAYRWDYRKLGERIAGDDFKYLFGEEESDLDYGQRMLEMLYNMQDGLSGFSMEKDEFGNVTYIVDDFAELASQLEYTEGLLYAFWNLVAARDPNLVYDNASSDKLIDDYKLVTKGITDATEATKKFIEATLVDAPDTLDSKMAQILEDLYERGLVEVPPEQFYPLIEEVRAAIAKAESEVESTEPELQIHPDEEGLQNETQNMLSNLQNYLSEHPLTVYYVGDESGLNNPGGEQTSGSNTPGGTAGGGTTSSSIRALGAARGKSSCQPGGDTLVNEIGPELISDNGRAFIANGGKPGFVRLSENAIVFTADETEDILHGRRNVNAKSMSGGSVSRGSLLGRLFKGFVNARAYKVCAECGATLSATATRCSYCGSRYLLNKSDPPAQTPASYWTCEFCGRSNNGDSSTCYYCGHGRYERPTQYTDPTEGYPDYQDPAPDDTEAQRAREMLEESQRAYRELLEEQRRNRVKQKEIGNGQESNMTTKNGAGKTSMVGTGGGNTVGPSNYESSSDPQKVDWIAVRINRIERAIADLEKIATSGFKKLETRLNATRKEIKKTTKEIDVMNNAYHRYMAEAEKVDLSSDIKKKIKNGTIDISQYDDETRKKIDEYTEWYEKGLDAKSKVEELHQNIAQLYLDAFEMVQTDFDNQLARIEHDANMTSKNLEMAQKRGYIDSAKFYEDLAANEEKTINKLMAKRNSLAAKMDEAMKSGEIAEGSEAWHQMKQAIDETDEALADANIKLLEYKRTIRSIEWTHFDYALGQLQKLTEETQFYVDLMSHHDLFQDNGQFNDLGEATAGMHAVNYDVYMAEADEYAKEIQNIQKELEKDPYDTELIERREQLLQLQRQSILAAEGEKEALKSLVQEGINIELNALKDLIEAYTDSLSSAKDLYEYQKKVTEKTADIASLQKQLSAYQNDTSEETRAKVQKLQNDLKTSQEELRETEWDQNISDQKKLLDDMYEDYEDLLNERLDNIDLLMQDMIAGTNENMDSIRNTLIEVGDKVGYTMTDQMSQAVSGSVSYYDRVFDGVNSANQILTDIYATVAAMARASGAVKAYATGGLVDYTGLAAVHGTRAHPELMLSANDTENFLEAAKWMREAFMSAGIPTVPGAASVGTGLSIGQFQVNIPIERVLDYNELVKQLQADPKFDRLINAMTLDRTLGKSVFGKNRISF